MKKKFLSLLLLFVLLSNILLVGCDTTKPPKDSTTESKETTNPQISETYKAIPLADNLIVKLTAYLEKIHMNYELADASFSMKLNQIAEHGSIPLHVAFDPANYYFACAYYNDSHEQDLREKINFCCASEYTWVGFENESDITEAYMGAPLVVIFQINKAAFCQNILQDSDFAPTMEHFQIYILYPEIEQTPLPLTVNDTFIYLTRETKDVIYCSKEYVTHEHLTFPIVDLNGEQYISEPLFRSHPDGRKYERDIKWAFGAYYDELMAVMITDKYSVLNQDGFTTYYGLFKLEDIVNIILKQKATS